MNEKNFQSVFRLLPVFILILSLFVCAKFVNEMKNFNEGSDSKQTNIISVSGDGEVYGTPDIATISFSVRSTQGSVALAQAEVTKRIAVVFDSLNKNSVSKKDIQTTGTSLNPQYQYDNSICLKNICPPPKPPVIVGYEINESVNVTIRNIDTVGKIISDVVEAGVSDLSGPNFSIDNQDLLKAQARKIAITKARAKALVLAQDLGVSLGKITSFSESGFVPPMLYATAKADMAGAGNSEALPVSVGQNKISSSVTIVYEIK